mgnify:CR=1 FL=1
MKNEYGAQCYAPQDNNKLGFDELELPFYGRVSLANGTEFTVGVFCIRQGKQVGRIFVGVEGKGAYTFSANSLPSYVAEKLGLGETDSRSMADFISGQYGIHNQYQTCIDEEYI